MTDDFKFIDHISEYPPVIPRAKVNRYFPWISQKRLANLDNCGQGPSHAFRNGRAVIYPTWAFLKWLDERTRPQERKQNQIETDKCHGEERIKSPSTSRRGRKTKKQEVQERRGGK